MPRIDSAYNIAEECEKVTAEMLAWLKKNYATVPHLDDELNTVGGAKSRIVTEHAPQTYSDFAALIIDNPGVLTYASRFNQDNARACLVEWAELRLYEAAEDVIDSWMLALVASPPAKKRSS
jgi:hypothetical protein